MIELKTEIVKEKFDDEEFEMLRITAETNYPSSEIRFFMNDKHMATTYTNVDGVAEAGISNTTDEVSFYVVCCDEQSETLIVNPKE